MASDFNILADSHETEHIRSIGTRHGYPQKEMVANMDKLDFDLIRELEIDARRGYADLATNLKTSPTTVARRFKKLLDTHTIRVAAIPDPVALGYLSWVHLGINARPGHVSEVADKMATIRNIQYIAITTGPYDMLAWGIFRDSEDLLSFLTHGLGSVPDVSQYELMQGIKVVKSSHTYLQPDGSSENSADSDYKIDELDFSLINEVVLAPRETVRELSERTGIPITSVHRRLEKLFSEGIIKVVCNVDPRSLGYNTRATIRVKVHPDKIQAVSQALALHQNVKQVMIVSGSFSIIFWAVFKDDMEMSAFVANSLGAIPGVVGYESFLDIKYRKSSHSTLI